MPEDPRSVSEIIERLDAAAGDDRVSVGLMLDCLGERSFGPFLLVPALIEISPIGGIPGLPTTLAFIILAFSAQMLLRAEHFWLPQFLMRRKMSGGKLRSGLSKLRPVARLLDRWFHGRLRIMVRGPFIAAAALCCMVLCLTVPPLEFFPFASTIPMLVIAMFGLAIMVRDGLLMLVAFCSFAGSAIFVTNLFTGFAA
ncbi:exopolysaccharide biosynthesis protein [Limoniibacter endophyticus]|uniref:Sugar transporter n=1 Tax=Limoniibacter endophyticus TaxID=1565040 RepID=A0A8J3DUE6_9HYPH|nr:exopolysaccharide biosynthesis protein [Limoniibacter endophyticus]GHC77958.1 sugar transporter [Limoniibacter endophyticus]